MQNQLLCGVVRKETEMRQSTVLRTILLRKQELYVVVYCSWENYKKQCIALRKSVNSDFVFEQYNCIYKLRLKSVTFQRGTLLALRFSSGSEVT